MIPLSASAIVVSIAVPRARVEHRPYLVIPRQGLGPLPPRAIGVRTGHAGAAAVRRVCPRLIGMFFADQALMAMTLHGRSLVQ
jgi:hypothetical protein